MDNPTPKQALEQAVDKAGGQAALARLINEHPTLAPKKPVKQQNIWFWLNVAEQIGPKHVLVVESISGVPRHLLRPDMYPETQRVA